MDFRRGAEALASVPLFAHLTDDVLAYLAQSSRLRTYPQGQILFYQGDPGDDLVVLESGQLRVSRYAEDGFEAVLAVVSAPAALGELALLDGAPRDATVTAQRNVVVRFIPRKAFMQVIEREPRAVEGLLRTLAGLVRAGNARFADFVRLDVSGRLAKWLLDEARQATGGAADAGMEIELLRSQSELAAELGTTRSTINRTLGEFQSLGLIKLDGTRIVLLRPDRLTWYAT